MLKQLRIQNIILIESAEISFEKGFNVISGETGAGKSAIMNGLNLIVGEKADASIIRRGFEKGSVEAVYDIREMASVLALLEGAGIDHQGDEDLMIRREISATNKSRAFINNQSVQLGFLRQIGTLLMEIAGQHANQKLQSIEKHREIVDLFAGLEEEVANFGESWGAEGCVRKQLENMIQSEAQRQREIETSQEEISELQKAKLKEGEEEELFAEYSILTNAEMLTQKVGELNQTLSEAKQAVVPLLTRQKSVFEQLVHVDPSLKETAKLYESALLELQEVAYVLRTYQSRIEHRPERITDLNDRLALINRLKRKYGSSIKEIDERFQALKSRLRLLQNVDVEIDELKLKVQEFEKKNEGLAKALTASRIKTAGELEIAVKDQLRLLNMAKVEFHVEVSAQKRNRFGDDRLEFFLSPNVGERRIPISECASGGELSRIMLTLQALLAGKEKIPTLIFDEIDANIGGETAAIVGKKLREIAENHQVLCITHFSQVARQAQHHLQISKTEREGRTFTEIAVLDKDARQHELMRMLGGAHGSTYI